MNLKQGQCHQIKSDNVDPEQGYNHAQFERSHFNGDREKADVIFLHFLCGNIILSPFNARESLKK